MPHQQGTLARSHIFKSQDSATPGRVQGHSSSLPGSPTVISKNPQPQGWHPPSQERGCLCLSMPECFCSACWLSLAPQVWALLQAGLHRRGGEGALEPTSAWASGPKGRVWNERPPFSYRPFWWSLPRLPSGPQTFTGRTVRGGPAVPRPSTVSPPPRTPVLQPLGQH